MLLLNLTVVPWLVPGRSPASGTIPTNMHALDNLPLVIHNAAPYSYAIYNGAAPRFRTLILHHRHSLLLTRKSLESGHQHIIVLPALVLPRSPVIHFQTLPVYPKNTTAYCRTVDLSSSQCPSCLPSTINDAAWGIKAKPCHSNSFLKFNRV